MTRNDYVHLTKYVSDDFFIKQVLMLAYIGVLDIRVSLSHRVLARRAPSTLAYLIMQTDTDKNIKEMFIPKPCDSAQEVMEDLTRADVDNATTNTSFRRLSDALPSIYDFEYFGYSDLVYPGRSVIYELIEAGKSDFRSFISPEKTLRSLNNNRQVRWQQINNGHLSNIQYSETTILVHQHTPNGYKNPLRAPVAFYRTHKDTVLGAHSLSELSPISLLASKQFLGLKRPDFIREDPTRFSGLSWPDNLDIASFHEACDIALTDFLREDYHKLDYVFSYLAYIEKWMPHFADDAPFTVTTSDVFIRTGDLKTLMNTYEAYSSQTASEFQNDLSDLSIAVGLLNKFLKEKLNYSPRNEQMLRYKHYIVCEFINQIRRIKVGKDKPFSNVDKFIDTVVHDVCSRLNSSDLFAQLSLDQPSGTSKVTTEYVSALLKMIMSRNWPDTDRKTFDF